jgi:signal transduction histidine kinase
VLEERNRLAGEIHDSLAQSFAGISMQLSAAARAIARKSKDAQDHVERANELARFGLSEACRSALSLRSNIIEELGLIEALSKLAEALEYPGSHKLFISGKPGRRKFLIAASATGSVTNWSGSDQ